MSVFVRDSLVGLGGIEIPCVGATQVWCRVYGTFVATYQPEVSATPLDNLWTKVDIFELETRRLFSTSSAGRVFTFSDLLGAAVARLRVTAYTSGTVQVDLRTLTAGTQHGRGIPYPEEVIDAYGKVTAPGAGVAVATVAAPGEGIYEVEVVAHYVAGVPAAAEDSNLELRSGTDVIGRIPMPRALNVTGRKLFKYVDVTTASNDLTVNAVGAATAGVVYDVNLYAQRLI